jgi:hypothetical protein
MVRKIRRIHLLVGDGKCGLKPHPRRQREPGAPAGSARDGIIAGGW